MSKNSRFFVAIFALISLLTVNATPALAANSDPPRRGQITPISVGAGVLSFLIWPGIGQAVNNNKGGKVATHAVLGLLPPYRFWSGYDALFDRRGGYWDGRI